MAFLQFSGGAEEVREQSQFGGDRTVEQFREHRDPLPSVYIGEWVQAGERFPGGIGMTA